MSKIKLTFSTGQTALATVQQDEPEFVKRLDELLSSGPLPCSCHHTISTGGFLSASPRPPRHPVANGTQTQGIGKQNTLVLDLEPGDISFPGLVFWLTYGPCSEAVPIGGPVIAKVDPDSMNSYISGCKDVWDHEYNKRELAVITFEKVEG